MLRARLGQHNRTVRRGGSSILAAVAVVTGGAAACGAPPHAVSSPGATSAKAPQSPSTASTLATTTTSVFQLPDCLTALAQAKPIVDELRSRRVTQDGVKFLWNLPRTTYDVGLDMPSSVHGALGLGANVFYIGDVADLRVSDAGIVVRIQLPFARNGTPDNPEGFYDINTGNVLAPVIEGSARTPGVAMRAGSVPPVSGGDRIRLFGFQQQIADGNYVTVALPGAVAVSHNGGPYVVPPGSTFSSLATGTDASWKKLVDGLDLGSNSISVPSSEQAPTVACATRQTFEIGLVSS